MQSGAQANFSACLIWLLDIVCLLRRNARRPLEVAARIESGYRIVSFSSAPNKVIIDALMAAYVVISRGDCQ